MKKHAVTIVCLFLVPALLLSGCGGLFSKTPREPGETPVSPSLTAAEEASGAPAQSDLFSENAGVVKTNQPSPIDAAPDGTQVDEILLDKTPSDETPPHETQEVEMTSPELALSDPFPASAPIGQGHCVVIDPGHQRYADTTTEPVAPGSSEMKYKDTGGTRGTTTGLAEYELNLQVSLLLRQKLEERGYQVLLTRESNDVSISNIERVEVANSAGADAFIRIHANGSVNSADAGALAIIMPENSPYNGALYADSRLLAESVLGEMTAETGANARSIWETLTMTGINWSEVPVTIVEMGFMTNPEEDRLMATEEYQERLAEGIAKGIDRYISERASEDGSTGSPEGA